MLLEMVTVIVMLVTEIVMMMVMEMIVVMVMQMKSSPPLPC